MERPDFVDSFIAAAQVAAIRSLAKADGCSRDQLTELIVRYRLLIGSNFAVWLAATWLGCGSEEARAACHGNLVCEVNGDHPGMLDAFARQVSGYDDVVRRVQSGLVAGRAVARDITARICLDRDAGGGLFGLTVLTYLECASACFIPALEKAGAVLGFANFEYVECHGAADAAHAVELAGAVWDERFFRGIHGAEPTELAGFREADSLVHIIFDAS